MSETLKTDRLADFNKDKAFPRIFVHFFEASYENGWSTLKLQLIEQQFNYELMFKFKGNLLNFYKYILKDKYSILRQKAAACVGLWGGT
jgi:hypothetical protein